MVKSLILAAILVATIAPDLEPVTPGGGPEVGDWRLSDVRGRVSCTLRLTNEAGPGGAAVKASLACRRAFPPLKDLSAWSTDGQGGILLVNAAKAPIVTFTPQAGGAYEAKAPDGKIWRLDPARPAAALTARQRMTGVYRLNGPGGGPLCELNFTSNALGTAGGASPGVCLSPWTDKPFAYWTLKAGRLTFLDRRRRPFLVMRSDAPGAFITADPRDQAITLVRR